MQKFLQKRVKYKIVFGKKENCVILTTLEGVPGKTIVEHYGLVQGSTIRAKHIGKDIMAGLKILWAAN